MDPMIVVRSEIDRCELAINERVEVASRLGQQILQRVLDAFRLQQAIPRQTAELGQHSVRR